MSSSTDYLRLNDQEMCKIYRESLPKGVIKTQNLLTVRDDILFIWNVQDSCIMTLNLKLVKSRENENVNYQRLLPTNSPIFTPDLVRVNESCTLLVLAGAVGVMVMELPPRGPPHGAFCNNKEVIYCKSFPLDERLFAYSKYVEFRQARWHPGSPNDSHLLVLTSDNMFRLYNIWNSVASLVKVHQIGTQPMGGMPGSRISFLAGLGETGIDFDFTAPQVPPGQEKQGKWEDLHWPIFVLFGNGTIYTIIIDIYGKKKPILKGPLGWYPPHADDSYEHCAIMCFKTTPPVLAISTLTGTIYHSVVLSPEEEADFENGKKITKYPNYSIQATDQVLHVFESIELELGLAMTDKEHTYCCPIFLHADESNKARYFCTHETGVHVVNIPFVSELENFLAANDEQLDLCISNLDMKSNAEYLLCTHATNHAKVNPILGFSLSHCPTTMIALLASGQMVTLVLVSHMLLPPLKESDSTDEDNLSSPLKKMLKESFEAHIHKLLKSELTQPFIKLSSETNPTPKECYELLSRATQLYREQHFKRFDKIREEIEKRAKALQMMRSYQSKELQRIASEKQSMQEFAESIAEKYEDIKDKQELLVKRTEKLLILATQKQPRPSDSETKLYKDLKKAEEKTKEYCKAITQLKNKQKYQEIQMANWNSQVKKDVITLGSTTQNTITNSLKDMSKDINELVEGIKYYKKTLGLK